MATAPSEQRLRLYASVNDYQSEDENAPYREISFGELLQERLVLIRPENTLLFEDIVVELNDFDPKEILPRFAKTNGTPIHVRHYGAAVTPEPEVLFKVIENVFPPDVPLHLFIGVDSSFFTRLDPFNIPKDLKVAELITEEEKETPKRSKPRSRKKVNTGITTDYDDLFREIIRSPELAHIASSGTFVAEGMWQQYQALAIYKNLNQKAPQFIADMRNLLSVSDNFDAFGKPLTGEQLELWQGIMGCVDSLNTTPVYSRGQFALRSDDVSPEVRKQQALAFFSLLLDEPIQLDEPFLSQFLNYVNYYDNPAGQVFIFEHDIHAKILQNIFGLPPDDLFSSNVFQYFDKFAPSVAVSENLGFFFAAVLLHPRVRKIWDNAQADGSIRFNTGRIISTYNSDEPSEEDHLGFRPDVEALAALAAFRKTPLPLAIALFGNWGSGKSSFMKQMEKRIDVLAAQQHGALNQLLHNDILTEQESPFCKKVVHITFNAWHFSDANLWACLMSRIFEKLRNAVVGDEKKFLEEQLKERLKTAKAASEATLRELVLAKKQEESQAERLNKAREENKSKLDELSKLKGRDVAKLVLDNPELQKKLKAISEMANVTDLTEAVTELRKMKASAQRAGERTKKIYMEFAGKPLWQRVLWLLGLLGAPVAIIILTQIQDEKALFGQIGSFIALISSGILGLVKVVRPALDAYNAKLDHIEAADQKIEELRNSERERLKREEENLQQELTRSQQELLAAQQNHDAAKERLARVQQESNDNELDQQLVRFIQSRQGDGSYDKHLGIISVIRKDFETLRKILHEAKADPNNKLQIDRIVLYIDDLDRCKSDRVVEVLEAVHLLMAFDIFVVVVGVDPRWVTKALKEKYGEHFDSIPQTPKELTDAALHHARTATTYDYLEKIFQVPFIVRPMESKAAHTLIDKLFDGQVRKTEQIKSTEKNETTNTSGQGTTGTTGNNTGTGKSEEELAAERKRQQLVAAERERRKKAEALRVIREQAEGLLLSEEELDYMKHLSPLVGQTPRTLIRYANLYRLLRVHEKTPVYTSGNEENLQHLKCIMLLLAAAVGSGAKAEYFFSRIGASSEDELLAFWQSLPEPDQSDERAERWKEFFEEEMNHKENIGTLPMNLLRDYAPVVARFSFHTLHIAVESPEKKPGSTEEKIPQ